MNALVYVDIDQGIHYGKNKVYEIIYYCSLKSNSGGSNLIGLPRTLIPSWWLDDLKIIEKT